MSIAKMEKTDGQLALALNCVATETALAWDGVSNEQMRADEKIVLRCEHATA